MAEASNSRPIVLIRSLESIEEDIAPLRTFPRDALSGSAITIRIPAPEDIYRDYAQVLTSVSPNDDPRSSVGFEALEERGRQWDADMRECIVRNLESLGHVEYLEHIFPSWHIPALITQIHAPFKACITTLSLQWRMDEPFHRLVRSLDPSVYKTFASTLYGCLSELSPTLHTLRLSFPWCFVCYGVSLIDVLFDEAILPRLRTLDLTHANLSCVSVIRILSAHLDLRYLILDQGDMWWDPIELSGCIESDSDSESDASGETSEERVPGLFGDIVERQGNGWMGLGAYIASEPRHQLRALSAALHEYPIQMFTFDLNTHGLRHKLRAGATAVAECEDVPAHIRETALSRVDALVLCDVWPLAYAVEETTIDPDGITTTRVHSAVCAHLEGYAPGRRPSNDVWPGWIRDRIRRDGMY